MKTLIVIISILLLNACSSLKSTPAKVTQIPQCRDCNIIIFTASNLRADHLSMYGYKRATDKALSHWMKNAVVFDNHYSVSKWPFQALMSLSTGLNPENHKVLLNSYHNNLYFGALKLDEDRLSTSIKMLPEILKENKYTTAFWGGSPHPSFYSPKAGFDRGIDHFEARTLYDHKDLDDFYKTLDQMKDGKFFINVNTARSHFPHFVLPKSFKSIYSDPKYAGLLPANQEEYYQTLLNCFKKKNKSCKLHLNKISAEKKKSGKFSTDLYNLLYFSIRDDNPEDLQRMEDYYDDSIVYTDFFIDGIFNYLEKNQLLKNTIVIVTSDLGSIGTERYHYEDGIPEKYHFGYGVYRDEVTKIPLIVYFPERAKDNAEIQHIENYTNTTDVVPTVLGLVEAKTTSQFDGLDLSRVISGEVKETREYSYGLSFRPQRGVETYIRNKDFMVYSDRRGNYGIDIKKRLIVRERNFIDNEIFTTMLAKLRDHYGSNPVEKAGTIRKKFNDNYETYKY